MTAASCESEQHPSCMKMCSLQATPTGKLICNIQPPSKSYEHFHSVYDKLLWHKVTAIVVEIFNK